MPDALQKLEPHRTMHLRGFDRRGAAAAMHGANASGFTVSGVFRDAADFAVLTLYDADDFFGHPRWRHLPDFDFSGIALQFDLTYTNLQPVDSPKFASIDWPFLNVVKSDGSSAQVRLWDHAVKVGGSFSAASAGFTLVGTPAAFDRVSLWYQNLAFDWIVSNPPETAAGVCQILVNQINGTNWIGVGAPYALRAARSGVNIAVTAARYGTVDTSGTAVTWSSGTKFMGLDAGQTIQIAGTVYEIAAVASATQLTLTAAAGTLSGAAYLADRGGAEGDHITLYTLSKNSNLVLAPGGAPLGGGSSAATWKVTLDFSALGLTGIRKMWLTFAPRLANSVAYASEEWTAVFTNWNVTDALSKRALKVAGANSVRVGAGNRWAVYTGGWSTEAGFYWKGFARKTSSTGDKVVVEYHCGAVHDLFWGLPYIRIGASSRRGSTAMRQPISIAI
jgi:hypothetical protein